MIRLVCLLPILTVGWVEGVCLEYKLSACNKTHVQYYCATNGLGKPMEDDCSKSIDEEEANNNNEEDSTPVTETETFVPETTSKCPTTLIGPEQCERYKKIFFPSCEGNRVCENPDATCCYDLCQQKYICKLLSAGGPSDEDNDGCPAETRTDARERNCQQVTSARKQCQPGTTCEGKCCSDTCSPGVDLCYFKFVAVAPF